MRGVGRWALLVAVAVLPACGCGFGKRPYANDPLLRNGHGVWGDHGRAAVPDRIARPEPLPPHAPKEKHTQEFAADERR